MANHAANELVNSVAATESSPAATSGEVFATAVLHTLRSDAAMISATGTSKETAYLPGASS